jgi:hypothetical protein
MVHGRANEGSDGLLQTDGLAPESIVENRTRRENKRDAPP